MASISETGRAVKGETKPASDGVYLLAISADRPWRRNERKFTTASGARGQSWSKCHSRPGLHCGGSFFSARRLAELWSHNRRSIRSLSVHPGPGSDPGKE